jgi:hypothetical protein
MTASLPALPQLLSETPAKNRRWRLWVRRGVATEPVTFARLVDLARQPFPSRVLVERLPDPFPPQETP